MPKFLDIAPISQEYLEQMGFTWHRDGDGEYIVRDKLIVLSNSEAESFYTATNTLYTMYEQAAAYVITNELFAELDIPQKLIPHIKKSWKNERSNHIYGRFDLSGGIDDKEIKLIEFNADTPTLLLESALIQAMLVQFNKLENACQFNTIYEAISVKFQTLAQKERGAFSRFLFSCVKGIEEERVTTQLLQEMSQRGGCISSFSYLEDASEENGFDFWFKLYPWEDMENFTPNAQTKMLNPAYTLLYQSKGILAILYKLFPNSPYLLESSFEPLEGKYVKKRMFGREGANIEIIQGDTLLNATEGIYGEYKVVYQAYENFVKDEKMRYYQAGVFYSDGACGIGFRRGTEILDDMSEFVGHIVL